MRARGVLAIAVLLVASAAHAQTAADIATARDLFREGMELRAQGKLSEALAKLKAAHDLYETPPSALELGRAQIDVGQLAEGYETLLSIERISPAKESERSKQARVEAKDLAERTKARIPTLRIDVSAASEGLVVTLDGVIVAPSLFGIARKIDPGHHVVISRDAAGSEHKTELDVSEGQTATATIEASTQVVAAQAGATQAFTTPRADRFSVLYKFLPPSQKEQWSLHAKNGSSICALPCEQWLGEHTGAYLLRAPMADDATARRVDVPDVLPATIGTTVTARPHAGKGTAALGVLGGFFTSFGVLGALGGIGTLVAGGIDWAETSSGTSNTGRDITIVGSVMTGVSAVLLVTGILLTRDNYAPRMDYSVAP